MFIPFTKAIVLTIVAAAVGAMAILGLIGILVNRFRKQRRMNVSQNKPNKRTKHGSPKRKKSNPEAGRKTYTINDDTYSMGTFEGGQGTFRTKPFPNASELLPPTDIRSVGGGPFTPTALDHSFIQSDDFDDVWSFIATDIDESTLPQDEENITLEGDGSFIRDPEQMSSQTPAVVFPKYYGQSDQGNEMFEI